MIVICGEGVVDLVPDLQQATRYRARPGGGPLNTAITISRLGTEVAMLARLSTDGFGRQLTRHLIDNHVDVSLVVAAAEPSSVAVAAVGADGSAGYRFLVSGAADWGWTDPEFARATDGAMAVHSGSLALALDPGAAAVERLLMRASARCTVSLDPNIRIELIADLVDHRRRLERCVDVADVVKVSLEDLVSLYPDRDPTDAARQWSRRGPSLVVMTDGASGSTAFHADRVVRCPAEPVRVVDTIGAGDAFGGALLDWLSRAGRLGGRLGAFEDAELVDLLRFASRVSAITCSRPGADPPRRSELTS